MIATIPFSLNPNPPETPMKKRTALHANFEYLEDGTLNGALDDADAARAMSLLSAGSYLRIDSEHVVHLDHPSEFVRIAQEFFLGP